METYHIKQLDPQKAAKDLEEIEFLKQEMSDLSLQDVETPSSLLMNQPISESEINLTFGGSYGAPGSDRVSASMLDLADRDSLSLCLFLIFNKLWKAGTFLDKWKEEIRAILYKLGKSSYHHCHAYRTISLTDVLGKRYEKISCRRLVAVLESQGFDVNQYAYLKERSATQAISLFIEVVSNSLKSGNLCGAVFFDFSDAFGSV